ncbi:MAG: DUF1801 domain-containing protein [Phycisphaerales bacterium]|nr:DUF1801 domain-containing protein [Phycisphaerales bacterium]
MQSKATTVAAYLAELPDDRRAALQAVRAVILKNIDKDFEEGMQYGMIGYCVPHRVFPAGYHCDPRQPLPFAGLASQKNYMSLYLMSVYGASAEEKWFRAAWAKTGKKLDMGKCCIRFKKLDDLALDVVAEVFRRVSAAAYVERYRRILPESSKKPGATRRPTTKTKASSTAKATAENAKPVRRPVKARPKSAKKKAS